MGPKNIMEIGIVGLLLIAAALVSTVTPFWQTSRTQEGEVKYNELTPAEEWVIVRKGTEMPFSGEYNDHKDVGTYTCRRCDAPLYLSIHKFDSDCGWPSYDDEIDGAVTRTLDADGIRTEITCTNCGAHLGHLFEGEQVTPKNIRHCVNSISLNFVPVSAQVLTETAYFAGGCFWGTEHLLEGLEGVISVQSGYMGGHKDDPTYEEICTGTTGHAETVEVIFDPARTNYETVAKYFFEIHDPTQLNRQGPDTGPQYRSAVFNVNEEQKETIEELIEILKEKGYNVVTEVEPADAFWPAEDYHQDYYRNTGKQPYCHFYTKRF